MKGHLHIDAESSNIIQVDYKMDEFQEIDVFLLFDAMLRLLPVTEELREEIAVMIVMGGIDKFFGTEAPIKVAVDGDIMRVMRKLKEKQNEG